MPKFCSTHRIPRARIDPIDSAASALAIIGVAMHRPPRHEIIVLLLDHERRGLSILVVSGTDSPEAFDDVVDLLCPLTDQIELGGVIVASVRPDDDIGDDDARRWLDASYLLADHGLELVEWFVIGSTIASPRDLLGEPARWA